ncbi:MAG: signal peptidase II [Candidatus Eremiobacteraeota bacterium]|nr:signal peptidase II [Candidatus Eremiobacteraeota bacterium]
MERSSRRAKGLAFWPTLGVVVLADIVSKTLAVRHLSPQYVPHNLFDGSDIVRLTLAYNPGAAFSMYFGPMSRWVFLALALIALGVLAAVYRRTKPHDVARALALGLVCAGAVGNVLDRLNVGRPGVVDFIDIGLGDARFYTFNVADIGVSLGAILLARVLWRDDREPADEQARVLQESGSS